MRLCEGHRLGGIGVGDECVGCAIGSLRQQLRDAIEASIAEAVATRLRASLAAARITPEWPDYRLTDSARSFNEGLDKAEALMLAAVAERGERPATSAEPYPAAPIVPPRSAFTPVTPARLDPEGTATGKTGPDGARGRPQRAGPVGGPGGDARRPRDREEDGAEGRASEEEAMSGHCPDCGNTVCLCGQVATTPRDQAIVALTTAANVLDALRCKLQAEVPPTEYERGVHEACRAMEEFDPNAAQVVERRLLGEAAPPCPHACKLCGRSVAAGEPLPATAPDPMAGPAR